MKFFQRPKNDKIESESGSVCSQIHVGDLVVAYKEQNLTMYNTKLGWDGDEDGGDGGAQRSGDGCPYLGGLGGTSHRAKPAHVQRQTGVMIKRYKMEEHNVLEVVALIL